MTNSEMTNVQSPADPLVIGFWSLVFRRVSRSWPT